MNLKTAVVADLKPHPDNPNTHPPSQIEALADSLTTFTQVKNVVIWNDRIIAGHGVVEAAKKAGILTLEVNDVSHWDEAKATAFMLADIRLPDMAIIDDEAMAEVLRAIDEPLDIPGFDEDYLAGLVVALPGEGEWNDAFSKLPEGDKSPYTQMTFTLHNTQIQQVKDALARVKSFGEFNYENNNSNGNALTRICEIFLTNGQS